MKIQLIGMHSREVFNYYSGKYKIFRDLYESDLIGLEIRNIAKTTADDVSKIFLSNNEICYKTNSEKDNLVNLFALGTHSTIKNIAKNIISTHNEDIGFKISKTMENISGYDSSSFSINGKIYRMNKPYIMGILNITPDSFSDGGKFIKKDDALLHAEKMLKDGADFIDIGGESTRPGAKFVSVKEELKRILPVIKSIKKEFSESVISVDTTKSEVAEAAVNEGANIINDISGMTFDEKMIDTAAKMKVPVILMHIKGTPGNMQKNPIYEDVVSEVFDFLSQRIDTARKAGIKNIIIDPGIGFGKRVTDNFELIQRLNEFKAFGIPILIGLSRKSFLGKSLNLGTSRRDIPTVIAETYSIKNGARIIRTHNVKYAVMAAKLYSNCENPDYLLNG